jgi:dTDP-4-amino-4,6-dideoxygalactose transaminase
MSIYAGLNLGSKMKVDFYSTASMPESLKNDYSRIFRQTLDNDNLIEGASCRNFEEAFSKYLSIPYIVGVGNGFDALKIGLQALGVSSGDRVAVPAHTFIATWYAVIAIGAIPVGVDVTLNGQIDLDALERLQDLKAVIPVHMHGTHCDMSRLISWAATNKVLVMEDCAQSAGLDIQGKKAGSWGDAAAFSFYPTKNLFALGDGGAIAFKRIEHFELARSLSRYGTKSGDKYVHVRLGQNSRLDSLHSAFLSINLKHLDTWNFKRKEIANLYDSQLKSPNASSNLSASHVYHHYVIYSKHRNELKLTLSNRGIMTEMHYPRLAAYEIQGTNVEIYPVANKLSSEGLSLPISPWQTSKETNFVISNLLELGVKSSLSEVSS